MSLCDSCNKGKRFGIANCRKGCKDWSRTVDADGNEIAFICGAYDNSSLADVKRCPMCGDHAICRAEIDTIEPRKVLYWEVVCSNQDCRVFVMGQNRENVIARWNRRTGGES